ncbi:hypothetical protein C8R43DRAFT_954947 [Mycena crocata]|nr:hypothetical protein C8R43DRAFT_954947 [Mycena crocata]
MEPQTPENRPLFTTEALEKSSDEMHCPADGIHNTEEAHPIFSEQEVASVVRLAPHWGLQVSGSIDYSNVMAQLTATKSQLTATKAQLSTAKSQLSTTKRYLSSVRTELRATQSQLSTTQSELSATQSQLNSSKEEKSRLQLSLDQALVIMRDALRSGWVDIRHLPQPSDSRVPTAMFLSLQDFRGSDAPVDYAVGVHHRSDPVSAVHHRRFGDADGARGPLAHRLSNPMALENLNNPIDNQTAPSTGHWVSPTTSFTPRLSAVDCTNSTLPVAHCTSSGSERVDVAAASESAAPAVGNRYDSVAERRASTSSPTCGSRASMKA